MTNPRLLQHLLDNRHRMTDQVIVDCLALADHGVQHCRIKVGELQALLQCGSPSHVSLRLGKLKARGLIDYEKGVVGTPGYLFRRVGPA